MLAHLAYVYWRYGAVSPSKLRILSNENVMSFILPLHNAENTTAPVPTFSATSLMSSFVSFCLIISLAFSVALSSTSSNKTTRPPLVDIAPSSRETIPKAMCSKSFAFSKPIRSRTLKTCLKCRFC